MNKDSIQFDDILKFFDKKKINTQKLENELKKDFIILNHYQMVLPKDFKEKLIVGAIIRYVKDNNADQRKLATAGRIVRVEMKNNEVSYIIISSLAFQNSYWTIHPEQYFIFVYDKTTTAINKIMAKGGFVQADYIDTNVMKRLVEHDPALSDIIIKNADKKILTNADDVMKCANSKQPREIMKVNDILKSVGVDPDVLDSRLNKKKNKNIGFF